MLRSQESLGSLLQDHSRAALGIASSMAVALVVGIFTGALLFGSSDPFVSSSPVAASAPSGSVSSGPVSSSTVSSPSATSSAPAVSASSTPVAAPAVTSTTRSPIPVSSENSSAASSWSLAGLSASASESPFAADALKSRDRSASEPPSAATDAMVRADGRTWAHVWFGDAAPMTFVPEAVPALIPWVPAHIQTVALRPLQPVSETFLFGPEVNQTLQSPTQTPQPVLSSRRR